MNKVPRGWNVKTVEQVFDFYPTASYSRDKQIPQEPSESVIRYIHYGDIHTQYNMLLKSVAGINATPQINKSGYSKYRVLCPINKLEQIAINCINHHKENYYEYK